MKKIAGKVTDIDFISRKSTLPTCPIVGDLNADKGLLVKKKLPKW